MFSIRDKKINQRKGSVRGSFIQLCLFLSKQNIKLIIQVLLLNILLRWKLSYEGRAWNRPPSNSS